MAASTVQPLSSWPLEGYEDAEPLPEDMQEDKSILTPQTGILSPAYSDFTAPLVNGRRGAFDVHIYYSLSSPSEQAFARALYERIRHEFPELRIYKFWDRPVGPHVLPMFEVNVLTPEQFGAFIPWLVVHRGDLSALVHPNTDLREGEAMTEVEEINHVERSFWLGKKLPLNVEVFKTLGH